MAGVYEPIEGRVLVDGKISPLFDMMPGLDVDDTGYQNIVTIGMLLGMSASEIEAKIRKLRNSPSSASTSICPCEPIPPA